MSNSVIIGPAAPSKSAIYAGVLSQIFADQDRRKQQKQQSQDLYFKQLADSIASVAQDPQEFSRRVGLLDENERQSLMSRFPNLRFGSYETPAQKTDRIRNQQEQGDMTGANAPPPQARDFNEAFVASGAGVDLTKPPAIDQAIARNNRERGVYKADLPETLQKANLADATLGDSGLRTAERISTGQQLNAQQQATIPSENALRGAQTQSALAEVPLRGAQAKEAQAGVGLKQAQATEAYAGAALKREQTQKMIADAQATGNTASMTSALVNRQASLDDFAKKGSPLRQQLIASMPPGIIAPDNEKTRSDLVGANNIASLMQERIQKIRTLAPVLDSVTNRAAIAGLVEASDGAFSNFAKGTMRNMIDPKVLDYITEIRNLREDVFGLRKYLANSPVRSDKQVSIMLSQVPSGELANSADLERILQAYEPAVNKLIIGTQGGGHPISTAGGATGKALDEATAKWFLQQAGGDKSKARQLAKQAGYDF